jgi:hypothetical protein
MVEKDIFGPEVLLKHGMAICPNFWREAVSV